MKVGYFVGNFLGLEDDWSSDENKSFVNGEKINQIFKDFEIVYFSEMKYSKKKESTGKNKFWHVFDVIARKND